MSLSAATKIEIREQVLEGIKKAFSDIGVESPNPSMAEMLKEHDEFINGNGKQGIKTTIPLMQKDLQTIKEFIKDVKKLLWGLIGTVGFAVLAAILNLVIK